MENEILASKHTFECFIVKYRCYFPPETGFVDIITSAEHSEDNLRVKI